jgi:hypothetical protein
LASAVGQRFGLQQVGDRAFQGSADHVQVVEPDGDRLVAPQRCDLAQRRVEADLLEGGQQLAGTRDVPAGGGHRRFHFREAHAGVGSAGMVQRRAQTT